MSRPWTSILYNSVKSSYSIVIFIVIIIIIIVIVLVIVIIIMLLLLLLFTIQHRRMLLNRAMPRLVRDYWTLLSS